MQKIIVLIIIFILLMGCKTSQEDTDKRVLTVDELIYDQ